MLNRSTFIVTPASRRQDNGVRSFPHGALAAVFVAVSALSAAGGGPAAAADPWGKATARVFYGDLNLNTQDGARRMWLRISQAANNSCGRPRTDLLPRTAAEARRCRMTIVVKAVRALDAPLVTAQFDRVYGPSGTLTATR
jgi:UrcA family protein